LLSLRFRHSRAAAAARSSKIWHALSPCQRRPAGRQIVRRNEEATVLATILIALVALIHVYIVILEMVLWEKPAGRKAFGTTAEFAAQSKVLAANQGLYNGFLVAGLAWGLWLGEAGFQIKLFFLLCVLVAGLFGAATASRRILFVQALPAALAVIALWFGW